MNLQGRIARLDLDHTDHTAAAVKLCEGMLKRHLEYMALREGAERARDETLAL